MKWLLLALSLAPSRSPTVEVQHPSEANTWALDWSAPPGCPTRADMIANVRSFLPALDEPPPKVPRADLRVRATVERTASEWTARIELSGRHGHANRSFTATSCEELANAVALVAAVSLDPVVTAKAVHRAREPPPAREPPEAERAPPPLGTISPQSIAPPSAAEGSSLAFDATPTTSAERPSIGVRAFGGGGFGPTDSGYGALGLGVAVFARRWRWSLDGGGWLPRARFDGQAAGRFSGWWIGSRGCVVPSTRVLEIPLCGGVEAGQILGQGLPPAIDTRSAAQPWLAASFGIDVTWVITERVGLLVDATGLLPLLRGDFDVGDQILATTVPFGVRASLGAELRF